MIAVPKRTGSGTTASACADYAVSNWYSASERVAEIILPWRSRAVAPFPPHVRGRDPSMAGPYRGPWSRLAPDDSFRLIDVDHFSASALSIAAVTVSPVGLSLGWKRPMTSPFLLTRNLVKFQGILPACLGLVDSLVRYS